MCGTRESLRDSCFYFNKRAACAMEIPFQTSLFIMQHGRIGAFLYMGAFFNLIKNKCFCHRKLSYIQANFLFGSYFYFIFILFYNSVRNMRSDFNFFYYQSSLRLKFKKKQPYNFIVLTTENLCFCFCFFQ